VRNPTNQQDIYKCDKDSSPPPEGDEIDPETNKPKKAGKFWVYEQAVKVPYYAIFNGFKGTLEVYHLQGKRYKEIKANRRGHYAIQEMGIELGILRENPEFVEGGSFQELGAMLVPQPSCTYNKYAIAGSPKKR